MTHALILGGADCLWSDLDQLRELAGEWTGLVIATNMAGVHYPGRVDHWVTRHPNFMYEGRFPFESSPSWMEQRAERGGNTDMVTWSHKTGWPTRMVEDWDGSTGLTAVTVAVELDVLGTLCGLPMDVRGHFDNGKSRRGRVWPKALGYQKHWLAVMDRNKPRMRSFSGWTAEQFGKPDVEWFQMAGIPEPDWDKG
jgi:hypothetical protein